MKIHVIPRHIRLTERMESQAVEKLTALAVIDSRIISAHIVLGRDHTADPSVRFSASARLALAGPDLHAEGHADHLDAAILELAGKLARQLRKRKTRLIEKPRSHIQRTPEKQPAEMLSENDDLSLRFTI